jgi:hypothetical protein
LIASVATDEASLLAGRRSARPTQAKTVGQLKRNKSFALLFDDAEFQRLIN